jgi:hypothetical protein
MIAGGEWVLSRPLESFPFAQARHSEYLRRAARLDRFC